MNDSDIDALDRQVNAVIRKINALAKTKQTFSFSHDDGQDDGNGDYDEDVSNPSMDASDNGNGDDDEPDDDDIGKLRKLGPSDREPRYPLDASHAGLHYPSDDHMEALQENSEDDRPGDLQTTDHATYSHHVQRAVNNITNTEHCDRTEAMRRLRSRYPSIADHGGVPVAKRAPGFINDLVAAEMAKGLNSECAAQRVAQAHGFRAFDNDATTINKRAWENEFAKRAEDIYANSTLDRCEALRATRLAHPRLYKALQRY
jgi:hypothetical protein